MTDAPERIWHSIDRKGKINGSPDAHVQPCEGSLPAYVEYVRADLAASWQPIETAPKDGTWFWARIDEDAISVRWHDDFSAFVSAWRQMTFAKSYGGGTRNHSPEKREFTHWMPLPAPPTE